jgi:purine-binding chemotaxis protein CheW
MRHVLFRLERERYALPLSAIREVIVAPESYTRVPRAPACVLGVMNLRGRVIPVVDLRAMLSVKSSIPSPVDGKVVLLDLGRRDLGFLISDVDGIESIEKVGLTGVRASPTVRGLGRIGAVAITVLDPEGLDAAVAQAFVNK